MTNPAKTYDIVVFGATGFTGRYITEELARVAAAKGTKWAVAGRNKNKIKLCLEESAKELGMEDLTKVPIIEANVEDQASLVSMAKSTKLIINAVGPYQKFGESVIRACIEGKTHAIDISGEPIYLESTQLNYNEQAKSSGIYLIGACGADSIPAEIGIVYTMKEFKGQLNEVESYLSSTNASYPVNTGTLESALIGIGNRNSLRSIRTKLYPEKLPKAKFVQAGKGNLFKSDVTNKWTLPFPGSDKSVVYRSQRFLLETGKVKSPVQYAPYWCENSIFSTFRLALCGLNILICSSSQFLRNSFMRFPGFFSLGTFSSNGATREQLKSATFSMTFVGRGWREGEQQDAPPTAEIKTRIAGPEFGYLSCSICAVQAAYVVLEESKSMPNGGGALPPGYAFYNTSYIDKLKSRGIVFENLSSIM